MKNPITVERQKVCGGGCAAQTSGGAEEKRNPGYYGKRREADLRVGGVGWGGWDLKV